MPRKKTDGSFKKLSEVPIEKRDEERKKKSVNGRKGGLKAGTPEVQAKQRETKETNKLIKGEIYSSIRDILTMPDKNGVAFHETFIQQCMKEARNDPNSKIGQIIFNKIVEDNLVDALDASTEKYLAKSIDFQQFRLHKQLFQAQQQVFDNFQDRNIIIICSRRAGKTELNARLLVRNSLNDNTPSLYINLTFSNAINQMFDKVVDCANEIGLPILNKSKSEGYIAFANGSRITFKGNSNKAEADKNRGEKYRLIIIDECGHQQNMNYLIDEVLAPCMMDYKDSQIIMTGTPPKRKGTYAEDIWSNKKWAHYHWDMESNPYIENVEEEIKRIAESKNVPIDSPFILREYKGLMGIYDTECIVFKDPQYYENDIPETFMPDKIYIGVDFGFADYNAIVGIACNTQEKKGYIFSEKKFNKSTVTNIINEVRETFEKSKSILIKNPNASLSDIGIYCDYSDESIIYEMQQTYGLPAYKCYKYNKAMAIEQLADDLRCGRIMTLKDGILSDEFEKTMYKRDEQDNITEEIDDEYHPDAVFALLYASRIWRYDWGEENGSNINGEL